MKERTCLLRLALLLALTLPFAITGCGDDDDDTGGEGEGEEGCVQDQTDSFDDAQPLPEPVEPGGPNVEGMICPIGDEDYFAVTVPDNSLMRVNLIMAPGALSQVGIHYNLYTSVGNNLQVPGSTVAANVPLTEVSCPPAGDYVLLVGDGANDAFDSRHTYQLRVEMEPDPDTSESDADIPLGLNASSEGYISCLGDTDRFAIDVPADQLLEVRLQSEVAGYEPAYRILKPDGTLLYQNMNQSGSVLATDISGLYAVPVAGSYVLEVFDWQVDEEDNRYADPDTAYTVSINGHDEPDPNDRGTRNDIADAATTIGTKNCGGAYAGETINGYLSAIGDVDWYHIPLSGCGNGIIQVSMDTTGTEIDPQIRLVRRYPDLTCARDEDCNLLPIECDCDIECSEWGNTCVGVVDVERGEDNNRCEPNEDNPNYQPGHCAGANTCIAGLCGVAQFEKNTQGGTSVATAQPLLDSNEVYLIVQDFRSDASSLDTPYTLRIETRADPDSFERDSVYNPYPFRYIDRGINEDLARPAGSADTGFTISGTLATENDQDWFYYANPCPDQGLGVGDVCTETVNSSWGAGPVDFVVTVVRHGRDWFQPLALDEEANQSAGSAVYGVNECFFAVEGESEGYYIVVEDNRGTREDQAVMDWSDTQSYTIRFNPYALGCNSPCTWNPEGGGGCNVN